MREVFTQGDFVGMANSLRVVEEIAAEVCPSSAFFTGVPRNPTGHPGLRLRFGDFACKVLPSTI
jgi:hypothetical protein